MTEHKIHEHHEQVAQHYEHAAKHHREAAKHHKTGNHEKAAHHARIAFGHYWRPPSTRIMPQGNTRKCTANKGGGQDVCIHIPAVECAGLRSLNERQAIEFELGLELR